MAVHRHADRDLEDRTMVKRPLGPLLITIDDLQAICDFLTDRLKPDAPVELSFLEGRWADSRVLGTMDSPEDLQLLSRKEMQYVRVRCADIRIDIFRHKAFCYASRADQYAIFTAWIQRRRRHSWQAVIADNVPDIPIALGLVLAVLYWSWGSNALGFSADFSVFLNILVGIGVLFGSTVVAAVLCVVSVVRSRPKIVPVRLPEWNKRRQDLWQHYRTISIALLSVSIAAATFVIGQTSGS